MAAASRMPRIGPLAFLGPLALAGAGEMLGENHEGINSWLEGQFGPSRFWPTGGGRMGKGAPAGMRRAVSNAMVGTGALGINRINSNNRLDYLNAPLPLSGIFNMAPSIMGGPRGFTPGGERGGLGVGPQYDFMHAGGTQTIEKLANVSMNGQTTLTGTVHIDMGSLGHMIGELVAKGLSWATGSPSTTTARPDGAALNPPT